VGGYVVTGRMLKMFKRSRAPVAAASPATVSANGHPPATSKSGSQP
jgi:hypothetical protein